MENKLILENGTLITLAQYQKISDLKDTQLSENFFVTEKKIGEFQPFIYAVPLIQVAQLTREIWGKPIIVNSGFRTHDKQQQLIADGYRAAKTSPHEYGMAFDVDTNSYTETLKMVKAIRQAAGDLNVSVRIGYLKYWNEDRSTFVHFDVCPTYYGKGMPYYEKPHPIQWEKEIVW